VWRDSTNEPLPYETSYPTPSSDDLAEYTGNYEFRAGTASVEAGDGGVVIKTPSRLDGPPVSITTTQVGPDSFISQDQGMSIPFVRDASGQVVRFLNAGYSYDRV
jgi:hypothetical protein